MKVFVAGVSSERQYVKALKSALAIQLRKGDKRPQIESGLRGDIARELLCNQFLRTDYDAILMLDLDMLHPPNLLEVLREHDKPIVSGHYWKRTTAPMQSIVEVTTDGTWPYNILAEPPSDGLMDNVDGWGIGNVGMGNVLIKREVIEAVYEWLPQGDHPFSIGPLPHLTGDYRSLGPDFRFFGIAKMLGYDIWVDFGLESMHGTTAWLSRKLYNVLRDEEAEAELTQKKYHLQMEVHGMNSKTLKIRGQELDLHRQAHERNAPEPKKHWDDALEYFADEIGHRVKSGVIHGQIQENKLMAEQALPQPRPEYEETIGDNSALLEADLSQLPGARPLLYHMDFWHMQKARYKDELTGEKNKQRREQLQIALYKIDGKIELISDWIKAQQDDGQFGVMQQGLEPRMPTFGDREEVNQRIANRHLGMGGRTRDEMKEGRSRRHKSDAIRLAGAVDGSNRQSES